jgi:NADPH-dependent 2,4-dienoyl-CoA reductase/sulfur reductase-like enzyme/peroxiredoxin family protein/rhodanese-related sulfurtransferase/TusA-related sulfurtransferase
MSKKIIIVGGVAGGASAATRSRRLDENAEIILLERDEHISFANCGLPYYIGGIIEDRSKLTVQTPETMRDRFAIDVRIYSEVTAVHPDRKVITINSKDRGIYEESYDALILSPGAQPLRPPISGIDNPRIFTLRNIPDTDRIKAFAENEQSHRVVIVGGGFIGVEMAENLKEKGLDVSLVEAAPHILPPFDSDMSFFAEQELRENGIRLFLGDGVAAFLNTDEGVEVALQSGAQLTADFIILAIGVKPSTEFLKTSGITLGVKGHIVVDEHMATSQKDIYAVGDAVEIVDFVTGQPGAIPLAGPANKQGRIAADNIAGITSSYKGTQGTSVLKVFNLTAASTGSNERTLKRLNIPYDVAHITPQSHATYYPYAFPLNLKMMFGKDGRILGAQAIGQEGVDKRIDVLATVIRMKGTVQDLTELELAYAPPYSAAKDPVNMIGYVAENMLAHRSQGYSYEEIAAADPKNMYLLDVRSDLEYDNGHFPKAVNIPVNDLRKRISEIDKTKQVLAYCQEGLRGYLAEQFLKQHGYAVKNLTGGYHSALPYIAKPAEPMSPVSTGTQMQSPSSSSAHQIAAAIPLKSVAPMARTRIINACGLSCPGPLMQVKNTMDELTLGDTLKVSASDPGFWEDIQSWTRRTHNELLDLKKEKGIIHAFIKKGNAPTNGEPVGAISPAPVNPEGPKGQTIVVFSGDMDKALASFVIANGAVAMGKKVTMFFTFWGLNVLRKPQAPPTQKGIIDRLFAIMMPQGTKNLTLSKMNFLGLGTKMMRHVMEEKKIASLEDLMSSAQKAGVEMVACQMSMDVMGIQPEELIDGVKIAGVGYYLGEAEDANVNLFI